MINSSKLISQLQNTSDRLRKLGADLAQDEAEKIPRQRQTRAYNKSNIHQSVNRIRLCVNGFIENFGELLSQPEEHHYEITAYMKALTTMIEHAIKFPYDIKAQGNKYNLLEDVKLLSDTFMDACSHSADIFSESTSGDIYLHQLPVQAISSSPRYREPLENLETAIKHTDELSDARREKPRLKQAIGDLRGTNIDAFPFSSYNA